MEPSINLARDASASSTMSQPALKPGWFDLSQRWALRLAVAWWAALGLLLAVAGLYLLSGPETGIAEIFLFNQDIGPALALSFAFLLILLPSVRYSPTSAAAMQRLVEQRGGYLCAALAFAVAGLAMVGWFEVYHAYPLSIDEFWASFDTRIFARGALLAPLSPEWRPFASALQPVWRLHTPGDAFWSSTYLPMNAAFRALFSRLGSEALTGAAWSALSVGLVYDLARKMWPGRRDAAAVAAILLASSSQFLVLAMSPYAMSAHLALNLAWLWLFLRRGVLFQVAAVGIAFVATGLHQVVFHPLFAAPFILQLWLHRRWRMAAFHTTAYAAICLFWISYWSLLLRSHGLDSAAAGEMAASGFGPKVVGLLLKLRPGAVGMMAENLVRFISWQNPMTICLAVLAVPAAIRSWRTPVGPLLAGVALTILVMTVVLPFQGHGWGYRYLHGFLGSLCLLAAFGWIRLTDGADDLIRSRAWAALTVITGFALTIGLPIRLHQVSSFIRPYAEAHQAILTSEADVVLVDPAGLWYAGDLVRNDPFLRRGPKIMNLDDLHPEQVRQLCGRYKVALFDQIDGAPLGITSFPINEEGRSSSLLELRGMPGCAPHVTARR